MVFDSSKSLGARAHLRALPGGAVRAPAGPAAQDVPAPHPRSHIPSAEQDVSDDWLVEGIVNGDQNVAVALYRRLLPVVEATLVRVIGRREADHEDLVQTSFEQIILTLSERRYARACSLKTWASTLAAHVGLKALRSRIRQRRVFDLHVEAHEATQQYGGRDDVERSVSSRQQLEHVRRELATLPPARAEAVLLHDVLGHGLAEIAAMTGSSVAAAQSRLSRGRRELSERLAQGSSREGTG
jgi:RNA polymerase sigma-70 factor (ECF subfamily)